MSMTELDYYDYQRIYGDDYDSFQKYRDSINYRTMIMIGDRKMFHTEFADSAIEAWIMLLDKGHQPVYVQPKEHD